VFTNACVPSAQHAACLRLYTATKKEVTIMKRPKMSKVISFRVTEEDWLKIERAAADSGETPNEWCRMTTLETLRMPEGLTPNQRILFSQIARTGFLLDSGFQLLAEDTLEEVPRLRPSKPQSHHRSGPRGSSVKGTAQRTVVAWWTVDFDKRVGLQFSERGTRWQQFFKTKPAS